MPRPRIARSCLVAALVAAPLGCNLVTGASDLEVRGATGGHGGATIGGHTTSHASSSSSSSSSGSAGGGGGAGATTGTGGGAATCSPPCGAHQYCETATKTCVCDPGFVVTSGGCTAAPPGDPSTHTQQEVCDQWKQGHVVSEPNPLLTSGADCDAGSLTAGAIADTLRRLNMFRWMAGLGPTSDDPQLDSDAQKCANLESWWPFTGGSPHSPPASSKCYTPEGGSAAGQSNIAWGSTGPAGAIDQWMQDDGNDTTLGHRRWIYNPPLDPVGIGYWVGGGLYGNAACLEVFHSGGSGPSPSWVSLPVAGFAPVTTTQWVWSFHGSLGGIGGAKVTVLRVDDNTPLAVIMKPLAAGYAQDAVGWVPSGWQAQVGKTYRVTVAGLSGGDVTYDVKPVTCN